VVQSIEVLRIFRALGLQPKHTIRCVLFVNEENGNAGGKAYAKAASSGTEKHLLAMETDAGGFDPRGFRFNSPQGDTAARAARWRSLFEPYGISEFRAGDPGTDVTPLFEQGVPAGELLTRSQRYFDIHHTREDSIDKVNSRELHLGAAALASLLWLVDQQGF
jgi:Zn-dependent M28 family amino/carboxypeptidase